MSLIWRGLATVAALAHEFHQEQGEQEEEEPRQKIVMISEAPRATEQGDGQSYRSRPGRLLHSLSHLRLSPGSERGSGSKRAGSEKGSPFFRRGREVTRRQMPCNPPTPDAAPIPAPNTLN